MEQAELEALILKAVASSMAKIVRAPRPFKIFGLNGSNAYAGDVAAHLGLTLTPHIERIFEDGECYVKSVDGEIGNVRGHNVFVIQSLYSDSHESVSDKLVKLCLMIGSLKDASAHEVTAVIPHLAWQRQDRKTESRAPIATKYIASMLQSTGLDRALFIDVHNLAAEQNAFKIPIDNLESKNLHAAWAAKRLATSRKIRVMTPDAGGLGRVIRFRNTLARMLGKEYAEEIDVVHFDKTRHKGKVRGGIVIGDVADADVVAYDDIISTGSTMQKACQAVVNQGGRLAGLIATHGLFCGDANRIIDSIDAHLVVTDTVSPFRLSEDNRKKLQVVSTTGMVADAIWRIHTGTGSISELLRS